MNPQLHVIEVEDLRYKIHFVEKMQWNINTDFQKVFDLILKVAIEGNSSAQPSERSGAGKGVESHQACFSRAVKEFEDRVHVWHDQP
ncbi:hypothetical protein IFM89_009722 [Coptis chinensis]|uniref:DUF7788 domain-containing protein n=1 Tax=Coptis chinensis TaxID=261450 RepID=A0A835HDB8_9MAGN|nr:hypothetical protein IFM89_009722 [Coptis chinensis]